MIALNVLQVEKKSKLSIIYSRTPWLNAATSILERLREAGQVLAVLLSKQEN